MLSSPLEPGPAGRPRHVKTFVNRLLELGAVASVLVSLMPLVAVYWWVFDLFTNFRLQLIAAQLLLVGLLGLLGRKRLCAGVAVCAILNVVFVHEYLVPMRPNIAAGTELTVMNVNVLSTNTDGGRLIGQIEQHAPDVVLMLEYTQAWAEALAPLEQTYPYRFESPEDGNFGLALYSKYELAGLRAVDLEGVVAVQAGITIAGTRVRLIGVHLRPPVSAHSADVRKRQLERLRSLVEARDGHLVLLGDFNLTPYSPHFSRFVEATQLTDTLIGHGPAMTWPSFLPILGIPIDHCFVSEELIVNDRKRLPGFGSDHYPVLIELALAKRIGK